jgi:glycosyltransferase involved in cell wall biosynthesis
MKNITEVICVIDQDSSDRTFAIMEHYAGYSTKRVAYEVAKFTSFGAQRNLGLDMVTRDWFLILDPDEVFTPQLDSLMSDLDNMPDINAVCLPCITLYKDRRHYLAQDTTGLDPHIHLCRNKFARFMPEIHENLVDINGRRLPNGSAPDIIATHTIEKYHHVGMKHMQLLKSDAALVTKGMRWKQLGALEESTKKGITVGEKTWLEWKHWAFQSHKVLPIAEWMYDVTSHW